MNDITQKEILFRYKEIFEKAYQENELRGLFQHESKNIGFACPLHRTAGDMQKDVLFVGINPSYRVGESNPLINSVDGGPDDYFPFEYSLDRHKSISEGGADVYFGKISELAQQAGLDRSNCGYLDLFVYRKTDQNGIYEILNAPGGLDFIVSQIEVFHDIVMHMVKPKLIVVLNAQVRGFLGLHIRHFKGKAEPENIWLGLKTAPTPTPTDKNLINQITGIEPMLSEDFNKRVEGSKPYNEMYILPYRYLRYVSKENIKKLTSELKEFKSKHLS